MLNPPRAQSEEIQKILSQPDVWNTALSYTETDQSYSSRRLEYAVNKLCERDKKEVIATVALPVLATVASLVGWDSTGLDSVMKALGAGLVTLIGTLCVIFFLYWLSAPREIDNALRGDLDAARNQLAEEKRKLVRVAAIAAENERNYLELASRPMPQLAPESWREELKRTHDLIPLQPNLEHPFQGAVEVVHEEEYGVIVRGHTENGNNFKAVVATYKNSPDTKSKRRIIGIDDVTAEVSYVCFDGSSVRDHHGAWLSEKHRKVKFDVPGRHDLIAATVEGDYLFAVERETTGVYAHGVTNRTKLTGNLFKLRIRLIDAFGEILDDYEMMLTVNREPELKIELLSAQVWMFSQYRDFAYQGNDFVIQAYGLVEKTQNASIETMEAGNMDLTAIRTKEREEEIPLAAEAKEWQRRVAEFIGVHRSEEQKKSFLSSKPSIDDGLNRVQKHAFDFLPKPGEKPATVRKYNWTLLDSLKASTEKLNKIFSRY